MASSQELRRERRRVEELLRQICLHLEQAGRVEDALILLQGVREYLLGEMEDN